MKVCVNTITVRFHLNHPAEKQAWEKLNALRRDRHQLFIQLAVDAMNVYGAEGVSLSHEDKKEIVHSVAEEISLRLQQILPAFLAGYSADVSAPTATNTTSALSETLKAAAQLSSPEPGDGMPDFEDNCMDFDFIGG